MPLEDPFFIVKEEVTKASYKVRALHQRLCELQAGLIPAINSKTEVDWTLTQLRNALRSIEWDLEDLEDTIGIVEKNPPKFRLDQSEILSRKNFIATTKQEVKTIKENINYTRGLEVDLTAKQPLNNTQTSRTSKLRSNGFKHLQPEADITTIEGSKMRSDGYARVSTDPGSPSVDDTATFAYPVQQQKFMDRQEKTIELMGGTVRNLRGMAATIGSELDDQALMLDDLGHDIECTDSKVNATLKKMALVMRMSSDRRQWVAIGALSGLLAVLLFMFFVL